MYSTSVFHLDIKYLNHEELLEIAGGFSADRHKRSKVFLRARRQEAQTEGEQHQQQRRGPLPVQGAGKSDDRQTLRCS